MEVKITKRRLKEELGDCNDAILNILSLISKAHDCIMEAQDALSDARYDNEDGECDEELLDALEYALDDLEADLSEQDHMAEEDPIAAFREANL